MAKLSFDWDEEKIRHLALHKISPDEAEQVFLNGPIDLDSSIRGGEERIAQLGETDTGLILVVVSTNRNGKTRVVTAWPAKERLRRYFASLGGSSDAGRTETDDIRE